MTYAKIQPQGILGSGEEDFGRPPIPDDLCKDSAPRHLGSGEEDF